MSRRASSHFSLVPILTFILVSVAALPASAQSFDASNLRQPANLDMMWRVQAGDNPAFARPDFDDSHWPLFDPHDSILKLYPQRPEVVWYRLHVKVSPGDAGLALSEQSIARAFEVYVNGERLMASGQIAPFRPYTYNARLVTRIPDRTIATGALVIAMRVHISPSEWTGQAPGYFAENMAIGQESTLNQENWLAIVGENGFKWLDQSLVIGLGLVALVLYAAQRHQSEYLWIAALGATQLATMPVPLIELFHNLPTIWDQLTDLCRIVTPYIWVSLYFAFVHRRVTWVWKVILIASGLLNALGGMQQYLTLPLIFQFFINMPFIVLLSVVVPIVLAVHWWKGNREAGILLIPVLLFSLYIYLEVGFEILYQFPARRDMALRVLNMIDRFPAGPFAISLDHVSSILSTFSLVIIMLLRSAKMSHRQAQLESEMAAAQQVQQLLVPEKIEAVAGFRVESIYQPAQEVGGDFFQILPVAKGGLLVVVGDVAGKGLPAAMLVSVLVGAIRGVAEFTSDPAELLANLNDRLVGRAGGGFTTALAAHVASNGSVTAANAGHLSPYLNGIEIELPGALPLGVAAGARYQTTNFLLKPGERLTFYSDGVVEAQNGQGELFGFERARAVSTKPAAAIVEAARKFGQQDDITVVTIERAAAVASAA
jgi:hypothetical protein